VDEQGTLRGNWVNLGVVAVDDAADPADGFLSGDAASATAGVPLDRVAAGVSPVPGPADAAPLTCPPLPARPAEPDRRQPAGIAFLPLARLDAPPERSTRP
jgi:hypothetical protein